MRKIKFKYIYEKNNKIKSFIFDIEDIEYLDDVMYVIHFSSFAKFDKYMLGKKYKLVARLEYTGLNDDKGNDIFEGDLLSNSENNNIFEVIFKDGCFMVKHKNIIICPLKTVVKNGCEVIGVISEIEKGLSKN